MKHSSVIFSVFICASLFSCQSSSTSNDRERQLQDSLSMSTEHTSQTALDWAGIYQDTLPCADCPGILTTVKLYEDETYSYVAEYIDRKTVVLDTGKFMWYNNGSVVHLKGTDIDTRYKVGENVLFQADSSGNVMESEIAEKLSLHKVF